MNRRGFLAALAAVAVAPKPLAAMAGAAAQGPRRRRVIANAPAPLVWIGTTYGEQPVGLINASTATSLHGLSSRCSDVWPGVPVRDWYGLGSIRYGVSGASGTWIVDE